MTILKAGGTVTIAEVCAAAKELGLIIRLPPHEWVARTPGKTLHGWLTEATIGDYRQSTRADNAPTV